MSENGRDSAELSQREMVQRYREHKQKGHELVKAMFRDAVERERERKEQERALVERVHQAAIEQSRSDPLPPYERPTIPCTELPAAEPNSQLYQEWEFYRREVGRLLAEGQEGRFILIKGEDIIGIWDTAEDAEAVAHHRYFMQPCLIKQVLSREPLLRLSSRAQRWLG
jgi:hypothetical protein